MYSSLSSWEQECIQNETDSTRVYTKWNWYDGMQFWTEENISWCPKEDFWKMNGLGTVKVHGYKE